jgi:hypothetical protein
MTIFQLYRTAWKGEEEMIVNDVEESGSISFSKNISDVWENYKLINIKSRK